MSKWLDTETKALLDRDPPAKLAPPDTAGFTLVLIQKGPHRERMLRALGRIPDVPLPRHASILDDPCPASVATGLTYEDALLGQFELVCSDAVSVILRDEVVAEGDPAYLSRLYERLRGAEEFRPAVLDIRSVPDSELGRDFVDQFVGIGWEEFRRRVETGGRLRLQVAFKKARIMLHSAAKIGGTVAAST